MKYYTLLPFLVIVLPGCSSFFSAPTAVWPWKGSINICQSVCTSSEALDALNAASQFCRAVQNYYENGGQRTNNAKLVVGGIGTIAGTVVAPVSGGSAAAAWSGLSGAANAFQLSIDEVFSSNLAIKRRKEEKKSRRLLLKALIKSLMQMQVTTIKKLSLLSRWPLHAQWGQL